MPSYLHLETGLPRRRAFLFHPTTTTITRSSAGDDEGDANQLEEGGEQGAAAPQATQKTKGRKGRRPKKPKNIARDKVVKFAKTNDPYNIPPESWTAFSRWIVQSQKWFPAEFGGALVDFSAHCHHYTADMWRTFAFHIAPIMFRPREGDELARARGVTGDATAPAPTAGDDLVLGLPLEDYLEFTNLIMAIKSAVAYSHTTETINRIEERMLQFSRYV